MPRWTPYVFVLAATTLAAAPALADRGAFSVEGGGGMTGLLLPTPYTQDTATTPGAAPSVWAGMRYALSNHLEVTLAGFYELPVTYFHNDTVTTTDAGRFPGTLAHTLTRFGGSAGLRVVHGSAFRLLAGIDAGWSRRVYTGFAALDDAAPGGPKSYGLALPDVTLDNLSLGATVGLEWSPQDHWSLALLPRAFALVGREPAVGLVVPFSFSWSWYLG